MMRRYGRWLAFAFVVAVVAVAQPRVTPLWGLYVTDGTPAAREMLFLDPFPSAEACTAAARAVGVSGQWTACRARLSVSVFASDRQLAFSREFPAGSKLPWLCGLRDVRVASNVRPIAGPRRRTSETR